jgi:hypothetical protein
MLIVKLMRNYFLDNIVTPNFNNDCSLALASTIISNASTPYVLGKLM